MITFSTMMKKGGVGKTTLTTNLGQCLAMCGKKVLLIDNDEQHNLTHSLGLNPQTIDLSTLLKRDVPVDDFIKQGINKTFIKKLDCITASNRLPEIEEITGNPLKELIESKKIQKTYDVCIIDCPPGINSVGNRLAITTSEFFILPTLMKQYSIDGLVEMMNMLTNDFNINSDNIIIVANEIKDYKNKDIKNLASMRKYFPKNFADTHIPHDENVDNIITEKKSLFISNFTTKSVAYYIKLMFEIFGFDDKETWYQILENKKKYRSLQARKNYNRQKKEK